jgi:hypothetical protein
LLDDTALRLRLAAAAKAAITRRFSSEPMLADYARLASSLLGR